MPFLPKSGRRNIRVLRHCNGITADLHCMFYLMGNKRKLHYVYLYISSISAVFSIGSVWRLRKAMTASKYAWLLPTAALARYSLNRCRGTTASYSSSGSNRSQPPACFGPVIAAMSPVPVAVALLAPGHAQRRYQSRCRVLGVQR